MDAGTEAGPVGGLPSAGVEAAAGVTASLGAIAIGGTDGDTIVSLQLPSTPAYHSRLKER